MRTIKHLLCPMRDGILLATDVYLPDQEGRYQLVLMRTPYGRDHLPTEPLYEQFTQLIDDQYAVAVQDLRGTGDSQGRLGLNGHHEHQDGYDAVQWLAQCDFCNGQVGMFGLSYPGFTQTAAAAYHPPALKAICPFMSPSLNPFGARQTMTLHMSHLAWAYSQLLEHPEHYLPDPEFRAKTLPLLQENAAHLNELLMELPLNQCRAAAIEGIDMFEDYREEVDQIENPAFWQKMNMPIDYDQVHTAAFYGTGWLDGAREWTIAGYRAARESMDEHTREQARLLIGPWPHDGHLPQTVEGTDFGSSASGDTQGVMNMMHRWFDRHLKGKNCDAMEARVRYFMLGSNTWHTAEDWPPPGAKPLKLYLAVKGQLVSSPAEEESRMIYEADPMHPTPSFVRDDQGRGLTADWHSVSCREDVVYFATSPLTEPVRVAGAIRLHLHAITDAPDTDFVCRLLDVDENGRETALAAGLIRAKYRKGFLQKEFITPNEPFDYVIDVGNTANFFAPGHRLAIQVCSYMYPDHDRNLNTLTPSNKGTAWAIARQQILCGGTRASWLEVPFLPADS